jgi:hypothetical protein
MDLEALWVELETRLPPGVPGTMMQRIEPDAHADLFVSVRSPGERRSLSLQIDAAVVERLDELPEARGVALEITHGEGRATMELQLVDTAASDVFTALATDVASAAAAATDDESAVRGFVGRFSRWMRLLQRAPRGLSGEQQRGLYTELWFLRERVVPAVGPEDATVAWRAPSGVPHDFQAAGGAVEVKSSASNRPQVVRINGERQLDDTGIEALYLVHVSLDVHRNSGETLPSLVESVRTLLVGGQSQPEFEDRLLEVGYTDAHRPIYAHTGYTIRSVNTFEVRDGFPRIVEADLAEGVGGVTYGLAIDACGGFKVPDSEAVRALGRRSDGL